MISNNTTSDPKYSFLIHLLVASLSVRHTFDPYYHTSSTSKLYSSNFLLSHTLPNSLSSLHNFSSVSATSAVSSANNSWFISNLKPFALSNSSPFPRTLTFSSRIHSRCICDRFALQGREIWYSDIFARHKKMPFSQDVGRDTVTNILSTN